MDLVAPPNRKDVDMAATNETANETVSIKRTTVRRIGWIAGGLLAFGATFAAGAVAGQVFDHNPGGHDFAQGHVAGGFGDSDGDGPNGFGHGDRDGDGGQGGPLQAPPGPGMGNQQLPAPQGGQMQAPSAPAPQSTP